MPTKKRPGKAKRQILRRPADCLSPNEAAKQLGCTGEAIKQHIYKGNLKAAKAKNGYWWVRKADLKSFVEIGEELDFKYHGKGTRPRKG